MSGHEGAPPGAVAKYDDLQRSILRGELVGLVAGTIMALGAVIAVSLALTDVRNEFGLRADFAYNYAGVQQVDFVKYLARRGEQPAQPSAEALQAYNQWVAQNPRTVNVQVLNKYLGDKYNDTANVFAYMAAYFTPGVGQSCEYCHNLQNFASYEKPQKTVAKAMLIMQFELQKKWVDNIPRPEGQPLYNIKCATCHNGQAKFWNVSLKASNPELFGVAGGGNPTPYDMRNVGITLNGKTPSSYEIVDDQYLAARQDASGNLNFFQVTADKDTPAGLNATYRNQYAMYHQNVALGVGCDFCHYGGYFKSYVKADGTFKWPKTQARHMQAMMQDIAINWFPQMPSVEDPNKLQDYYAQPNCYMCHRGHVVPPGAYLFNEPILPGVESDIKPIVDLPLLKPILPNQ